MPEAPGIRVGPRLVIPSHEVSFRATRAGGPGGQHVNTSSTRVELWWNAETSGALSELQRGLVRARLAGRLDGEGWLRLVESGSRSQLRNREAVTGRFADVLAAALVPIKVRKPTRVPKAQKIRRLESKKTRSTVKKLRGRVRGDE